MNPTSESDNNLSDSKESDSHATNEEGGSSTRTEASPYALDGILLSVFESFADWSGEPIRERKIRNILREELERRNGAHVPDTPSADDIIEKARQEAKVIRDSADRTLQPVVDKEVETVELEIGGKVQISKLLTEIQSESGSKSSKQRK